MVEIPYEPQTVNLGGVTLWRNHEEQVQGKCDIDKPTGQRLIRSGSGFDLSLLSPLLRGTADADEHHYDLVNPQNPGGSVLWFTCHEPEPIANNHEND